ncbi:MAG: hypothetical protein ACI3T9_04470 [Romboutsia timonensis]
MKDTLTYRDMINGLQDKITACRIEIEALKEERQYAEDRFQSDYDDMIQEQYDEIHRLHKMRRELEAIYREVR